MVSLIQFQENKIVLERFSPDLLMQVPRDWANSGVFSSSQLTSSSCSADRKEVNIMTQQLVCIFCFSLLLTRSFSLSEDGHL